jgi:outer membrane protein assembly factor BamA
MGEGGQGSRHQAGVGIIADLARLLAGCCAAIACSLGPAAAQEPAAEQKAPLSADSAPSSAGKIPSFAELEAAGAVIGEVRIDNRNIFDLADEKENGILYRAANALHIRTRAAVVRRQLLFKPGERVSVRLIEETERLIRSNRIFYDVSFVPVAYRDGVVDIEVTTFDTWTLEPGVSASRAGGVNKTGFTLRDTNALGTGVLIGASRSTDADRSETKYTVSQLHAFDGWTAIDFSHSQLSDGQSNAMSIARPFYALDTRWAAGFSASTDTRIDSVFSNGAKVAQLRHSQERAEAYGGWSAGLVDHWTQRYSAGLSYVKDTYKDEPDLTAPVPFPPDQTLAAPFFRYEVVQDNYEKVKNRDLIERPEYFAMGTQSSVQLGRALTGLGSTQNLWLYSASAGDGFRLPSNRVLLGSASVSGQTGYAPLDRQLASGSIRFYDHHSDNRTLTFVSLSGGVVKDPNLSSQLVLGGDTGLRGYPRNYQTGERLVLLNVEERVYTDWYPFRLIRVGAAAFYDLGRAWDGPGESPSSAHWLSNVGFGLRFLSTRSAFGNVLHVDFAFPLNRDPNVKSFQFLVTTKLSL